MPDVATQTLGSLPILQHAHASVATQTKLLRVPQGECSPWRRMVLGLLTEMDCEGTMRAVHDGWTVEQGKQRSREVNACFTYNVHLITGDWNTKARCVGMNRTSGPKQTPTPISLWLAYVV